MNFPAPGRVSSRLLVPAVARFALAGIAVLGLGLGLAALGFAQNAPGADNRPADNAPADNAPATAQPDDNRPAAPPPAGDWGVEPKTVAFGTVDQQGEPVRRSVKITPPANAEDVKLSALRSLSRAISVTIVPPDSGDARRTHRVIVTLTPKAAVPGELTTAVYIGTGVAEPAVLALAITATVKTAAKLVCYYTADGARALEQLTESLKQLAADLAMPYRAAPLGEVANFQELRALKEKNELTREGPLEVVLRLADGQLVHWVGAQEVVRGIANVRQQLAAGAQETPDNPNAISFAIYADATIEAQARELAGQIVRNQGNRVRVQLVALDRAKLRQQNVALTDAHHCVVVYQRPGEDKAHYKASPGVEAIIQTYAELFGGAQPAAIAPPAPAGDGDGDDPTGGSLPLGFFLGLVGVLVVNLLFTSWLAKRAARARA